MHKPQKPIRVLHFYKTCYPYSFGGVEQVIHQLCRGGASNGIENKVLVLSPDVKDDVLEIDGYQIHRVKQSFEVASTGFSISVLSRFKALLEQTDIIHYHFPWPFMDLVHFYSQVNKPTVVSYHSDIIRQKYLLKLYRPLMHRFLSDVTSIISASPNYLASSEVLKRYQNKTKVIPFGLDRKSYSEPTSELLDYWQNITGEKFFLFLGALRYYKGLHILMEALVGLEYPVIIAGSGPVENELKVQAEKLGLKNVLFVNEVSEQDKVTLFKTCYAVVFPSHLRSEAFGIVLLEGAMFGKPLISSEIGTGTTFVNIDGETGLVIPPSDVTELRNAMCYLWDNPTEAKRMGDNAQKRYWELFSAEKMISSYSELYRELIIPPR
ncbi:MAG: glycosyltransferase [Piscirickettsiaceae bacterium]|nr:glycosyltransferase [Piscirickettsiaceae bacterium]